MPRYRNSDDERGQPAVPVQPQDVVLQGKIQLLGPPRHALPRGAEGGVRPARCQVLAHEAGLLHHGGGQVDAAGVPVLAHVAQDVRELHGHAQRHGVGPQRVVDGPPGAQQRQQHEAHRARHVVAVVLELAQVGGLPEGKVAPLPLQHVEERGRVLVEGAEHPRPAPATAARAACRRRRTAPGRAAGRPASPGWPPRPRSRPPRGRTRTRRTRRCACAGAEARTRGRNCASFA